jgi:hypothetical protein
MSDSTRSTELAQILYPNITQTPEDIYAKYPSRNLPSGSIVTRFAPSPTGFIHIGSLYATLVPERFAHLTDGVFFLRIEDTDTKRELVDGVSLITNALGKFGVQIDEGVVSAHEERGAYGPYTQSKRLNIYHVFAKYLVEKGQAYPCFLTPHELDEIRKHQESTKIRIGIYGEFAKCRNIYDGVKHNHALIDEVMKIPERTRIVRNDQKENSAVSFAKRGNGLLFAAADMYDVEASIVSPEIALPLFSASPDETSNEGDASLDKKFKLLHDQIMTTKPAPVIKGTRAEALTKIRFLRDNYVPEKDFLSDLHDVIKNYDDLSDGEMKFIRQLNLVNQAEAVQALKDKFSIHYLDNIRDRADGIDRAAEIIMFTEDLRK